MNTTLVLIALLCILVAACSRETPSEKSIMSNVAVKQIQPLDSSILEEWVRVTDDEDILGVSASRSDGEWSWTVSIHAAEFIREEPLESELQESIEKALTSVSGVTAVAHEDREVWIIKGNPKGEDLVKSCSSALDNLSDAMRKAVSEL